MKMIKPIFDPKGILNPYKVLPSDWGELTETLSTYLTTNICTSCKIEFDLILKVQHTLGIATSGF